MTEDQIERRVEAMFDALASRWTGPRSDPDMTQADYDLECRRITAWAESRRAMAGL